MYTTIKLKKETKTRLSKFETVLTPGFFEDFLILPISKSWITVFGEMPKFSIKINKKGKLVFESIQSIPNWDYPGFKKISETN